MQLSKQNCLSSTMSMALKLTKVADLFITYVQTIICKTCLIPY